MIINGINFTARVHPKSTTKPGDKIKIAFDMNAMHLFDKETENAIVH
jgi:multiple sugar transport system ATP-binding protein